MPIFGQVGWTGGSRDLQTIPMCQKLPNTAMGNGGCLSEWVLEIAIHFIFVVVWVLGQCQTSKEYCPEPPNTAVGVGSVEDASCSLPTLIFNGIASSSFPAVALVSLHRHVTLSVEPLPKWRLERAHYVPMPMPMLPAWPLLCLFT